MRRFVPAVGVFACSLMVLFAAAIGQAADTVGEDGRLILGKANGDVVVRQTDGQIVFRHKDVKESIEWALRHGNTVIVSEGDDGASSRIDVPRDGVTLIIGQNATIRPAKDADMAVWPELKGAQDNLFRQLIYNKAHDNVRIINFGTLVAPATWWDKRNDEGHICNFSTAIWFDGRPSWIQGGLVCSPGNLVDVDKHGHGVAIHNADSVRVPFLYSSSMGHAVLWLEGCRGCRVGTVINIAAEGSGEGETVDLNAFNKNTVIDTVIGVG